ncbi:ATP-binding protein [Streptomyces sp. NPDC059076]
MAGVTSLTRAAEELRYSVRAAVGEAVDPAVPLKERCGWRSLVHLVQGDGPRVLVVPSTAELAVDGAERALVLEWLAGHGVAVEAVRPAAWELPHWRRIWASPSPPAGARAEDSGEAGAVRTCRAVFPAHLEHTGAARRLVRDALRGWGGVGLDHDADLVGLAVHELVANAIEHGSVPGDLITVTVDRDDRVLRVGVEDRSMVCPQPRAARGQDCRGRGLRLVEDIADRWGTVPRTDRTGKEVYLLLTVARRRPQVPVAA